MVYENQKAEEFDKLVDEYIEYLENPKVQRKYKLKAFMKGVASVFDISGKSSSHISHPIYSRNDLTSSQKNLISTASAFKKTEKTLDKILAGEETEKDIPKEEAVQGRKFANRIYEDFKKAYINSARRKTN